MVDPEPISESARISVAPIEGDTNLSIHYTVIENRINFDDINDLSEEVQRAIGILASQGIISGVGGDSFAPDTTLTRAQLAQILTGMLGIIDSDAVAGFEDVSREQWFYPAVASVRRHGLMDGTADNTFSPNMIATREHVVSAVARALSANMGYSIPANPEAYLQRFTDHDSLADWSRGDIALAAEHNLDVRRADGRFSPHDPVTRGDVAVILYRLYERLW